MKLVIGNKNYSSWSLRPWLLAKQAGIPFEEIRVRLFVEGFSTEIRRYSPAGRVPVLVDGFISSVAALIAARLCPACKDYMLGSHASDEPASKLVLSELGLEPFLYAGMRLGEGTGAVAVMPLLDMGLAVYREMTTFEAADIEAYQPLS